jgi:CBS domain-containing protein
MYCVNDLLQTKGAAVWTVSPDDTVMTALRLMAEHDIGALVVTESGKLVGILSERDYARKVVLHGKTSAETRVREIMTSPVIVVSPEQPITDCMALMTDRRIRHLPVVADGSLTGVVSIGDVVKAVISDQAFEIEQLAKYISGQR